MADSLQYIHTPYGLIHECKVCLKNGWVTLIPALLKRIAAKVREKDKALDYYRNALFDATVRVMELEAKVRLHESISSEFVRLNRYSEKAQDTATAERKALMRHINTRLQAINGPKDKP